MERENQELKLIIDSSPIIIFYKDKEGKFMRVNKAFSEALKIPQEKFLGKTAFDLYSADIAQEMTNDDQEVFKSGRPKLNIVQRYEAASEIRWAQTDKVPIFDKNGVLIGLVGFVQDITGRRKTEESLRESEGKFRNLFENARDGLILADPENRRFSMCNNSICKMLGYTEDELNRLGVKDIHPEKDLSYVIEQFERLAKGEIMFAKELPMKRKDGSIFYADVTASLVVSAGKKYLMGSFQDITERKQAAEELRKYQSHLEEMVQARTAELLVVNEELRLEVGNRRKAEIQIRDNERRFREIAESLPQMVWTCVPDGSCDYLSRQWMEYTGIPEAEQLGSGWLQQVHPDDRERVIAAWNKATKKNFKFDLEFRIRRADGVYRWFKTRAVPLRGADGAVVKWFGSNTDIEDLKLAEEALKDSEEKMRVQKEAIVQKNIAIREIMEQIGAEKYRIKENVLANVDKILLPILRKLRVKATRIDRRHIDVLQKSLEELVASFSRTLADTIGRLTPREVEICSMIRSELTSKEMSKMLGLSRRSIETHRQNIRKKLGLANRKVNLTSYLHIH